MIRVIRAEWRKLRRPTLFLGTLGAVGAISILTSSIPYIAMDLPRRGRERGFSRETIEGFTGLSLGLAFASTLLGIVALSVFASQTAQEYSHGTLRNLLVRQPRRMVLLGGKAIAMALFGLLVVLETAIISVVAEFIWANAKGISTSAWTAGGLGGDGIINLFTTLGNVALATIGFGIIGMLLGLVLRSPISSIAIGISWVMVVEGIVGAVWESTQKYLPGQLLAAVGTGGSDTISYKWALTTSVLILIGAGALAAFLFKKRDVSS